MLLKVESTQPAKSGKSIRVKAGGEWYGAKKDSGITAGMTIEAEVEDGEFGKWIGKYRQVANGNGSTHAAPQSSNPPSSSGAGAAGAAPIWSNFVSNQVAHAIAAGKIEDPTQIKVWAAAAKQAFTELL